ncbi:MAG: hypothetical protein KGZ68_17335 [Dechloromonas sp.]|nr:hypothetical protein [Dechloromonas sp.]
MSSANNDRSLSIEAILTDPSTSFWLRDALRTASQRDPVDALNDAECLRAVLQQQLDAIVQASCRP